MASVIPIEISTAQGNPGWFYATNLIDPNGTNGFSDFFTKTIPNAVAQYGPGCIRGAVQGLAVGVLTGETETGVGAGLGSRKAAP